jgi:hypothetical protein
MGTDVDSGTGTGTDMDKDKDMDMEMKMKFDRYLSRIINCYPLKTLIVQKLITLTFEC